MDQHQLYVRIETRDGEVLISEFQKLKGIRKLSADVMAGRKAFPVWKPVAETHPVSGEPVSVRRRIFLNGDTIARMETVQPLDGMEDDHNFDPDNFVPEPIIKRGEAGLWTCPENIEGGVVGVEYPIHRDTDHRRYVILTWAEEESEQVRHYLDEARAGSSETFNYVEDDDDWDDDWDEDDHV